MGVTVEDTLRLPSMKHAKVLGGRGGLGHVVLGTSVFEYMGSPSLQDEYFILNENHLSGHMVLASFANMQDDVKLQERYLRRMAASGEACLVLYYVGIIMKKVDERLIKAADELSFPLIMMSVDKMYLRYGDLIAEVGNVVLSDRMNYDESLVTEVIGHVSSLPSDKQTVDSVLSILRDRLKVSLILTDSDLNSLGAATWPSNDEAIADLLTEDNVSHHPKRRKLFSPRPGSYIWYVPIHDRGLDPMRLFFIESGSVLTSIMVDMAREAVQLAVELWSNKHSAVLTSELVKAILNDEPIRMRRLSEVLNIDIRNIHCSWFIRCTDNRSTFSKDMVDAVRKVMDTLDSDIILEPYRTPLGDSDDLVMFFKNPLDARLLESCGQEIIHRLHELGCEHVYLTMLDYKFSTSDVRTAFSIWNENEATARIVFPTLEVFHESEIELVRQCNEIIRLGEASIASATGALDALEERHGSQEFLRTLEVYFLDSDMNMQKASEILNVHKNTIKYRINMVCDALGHSVNNPVTTSRLTIALAIRRLLDKASN